MQISKQIDPTILLHERVGSLFRCEDGISWWLSWPFCTVTIYDGRIRASCFWNGAAAEFIPSDLTEITSLRSFLPFGGAILKFAYRDQDIRPCLLRLFLWKGQTDRVLKIMGAAGFPVK
jgi:hypothetical protein